MARMYEYLLGGAVAVVSLIVLLSVQSWLERRRRQRLRRLGMEDSQTNIIIPPHQLAGSRAGAADRIDSAFDKMVDGTGMDVRSTDMVALMCLLAVLLGGGVYLWRDQMGLGIMGFLLGLLIPLAIVWFMRNRYRQKVQTLLPDALYLLARSLRAGMSLQQAIELVAEEGPKPIATEFERCAVSLHMGLSPATVIQMMADRLQLLDLNAFATTVAFHQSTGGNLPLLLDRLAAGARDRNQFRGQFWAATAQGRITSIALAAAGPLLVLGYLLFQPEHVQTFLNSSRGWLLLVVAAIMEAIGMMWVYQILKIDY